VFVGEFVPKLAPSLETVGLMLMRAYSIKRKSTPFVTLLFIRGPSVLRGLGASQPQTGWGDTLLSSGKLHNCLTPDVNFGSLELHFVLRSMPETGGCRRPASVFLIEIAVF
jgi:hypothetical protein